MEENSKCVGGSLHKQQGVRGGVGGGNVKQHWVEGCVPSLQTQITSIKLETKLHQCLIETKQKLN